MSSASGKSLEHLAERIHSLIDDGAKVTWDVKVRDPDTSQPRQVDVLIDRAGHITHVECRDHSHPQDVTWVEELVGRRQSLRADSVMGVSLSGFTRPALAKARAMGIFLRDFIELSDEEIRSWGKCSRFVEDLVEFSEIDLAVEVERSAARPENLRLSHVQPGNVPILQIVDAIAKQVESVLKQDRWITAKCSMSFPGLHIGGVPVAKVRVRARARLVKVAHEVAAVLAYGDPSSSGMERDALIEKRLSGNLEVIHGGGRAKVIIDVSKIKCRHNHYFLSGMLDMGRPMSTRLETIGGQPVVTANFDYRVSLYQTPA